MKYLNYTILSLFFVSNLFFFVWGIFQGWNFGLIVMNLAAVAVCGVSLYDNIVEDR